MRYQLFHQLKDLRLIVEFSADDTVTFKSYEKAIECKVVDVVDPSIIFSRRTQYNLHGISTPCVTKTTGGSIMESVAYKEWDGKF